MLVGGLFAVLAGNNALLMWVALPFAVFFASYAASTVGFVLSQAAFTVNLIIVFNLISPAGWQVGLVRIEDVAVGAAVSVLAGVLLWPRGARQDLARSTSGFYRAISSYLAAAFDRVLGIEAGMDLATLLRDAVRARDRAGESLQELLSERGARHLDPQAAATLVTDGNEGMLVADALILVATDLGYDAAGCREGATAVRNQVRALLRQLSNLADRLEGVRHADGTLEPVSIEALRSAALGCLERKDGEVLAGRSALALVIAGEWAQDLARLEAGMEQVVSTAVAAERVPWWR